MENKYYTCKKHRNNYFLCAVFLTHCCRLVDVSTTRVCSASLGSSTIGGINGWMDDWLLWCITGRGSAWFSLAVFNQIFQVHQNRLDMTAGSDHQWMTVRPQASPEIFDGRIEICALLDESEFDLCRQNGRVPESRRPQMNGFQLFHQWIQSFIVLFPHWLVPQIDQFLANGTQFWQENVFGYEVVIVLLFITYVRRWQRWHGSDVRWLLDGVLDAWRHSTCPTHPLVGRNENRRRRRWLVVWRVDIVCVGDREFARSHVSHALPRDPVWSGIGFLWKFFTGFMDIWNSSLFTAVMVTAIVTYVTSDGRTRDCRAVDFVLHFQLWSQFWLEVFICCLDGVIGIYALNVFLGHCLRYLGSRGLGQGQITELVHVFLFFVIARWFHDYVIVIVVIKQDLVPVITGFTGGRCRQWFWLVRLFIALGFAFEDWRR